MFLFIIYLTRVDGIFVQIFLYSCVCRRLPLLDPDHNFYKWNILGTMIMIIVIKNLLKSHSVYIISVTVRFSNMLLYGIIQYEIN